MNRPDAPQRHIAVRTNLLLVAGGVGLNLWLWLGLPLALPNAPLLAWTLLPLVLATTTLWSVMHEGIHAVLHPRRAVNDALSRLLAIGFPAPFAVLRFGHLKHHQFNRTALDRTEVYDPAENRSAVVRLRYYLHVLGGLYFGEVAALLLVWLPRQAVLALLRRLPTEAGLPALTDSVERQLLTPEVLRTMRIDSLLSFALIATGSVLYLQAGALWLLVLALMGRGLLISLTDNAYHYATPLHAPGDDVRHALNLRLPRWASRLILHFNLHAVHHRHPALPWNALPAAAQPGEMHGAPAYLRALLRQLRGPLPLQTLPRRADMPTHRTRPLG